LKKQVGVAEKRFCKAKTFEARGSSVEKGRALGKIGLPFISIVLPLLNLLTLYKKLYIFLIFNHIFAKNVA
jgi:hypothetical protein